MPARRRRQCRGAKRRHVGDALAAGRPEGLQMAVVGTAIGRGGGDQHDVPRGLQGQERLRRPWVALELGSYVGQRRGHDVIDMQADTPAGGIDIYERPLLAKGFLICSEVGFAVIYPASACGYVDRGP